MTEAPGTQHWYDAPEPRAALTAIQFLTRLPVQGGATRDLSAFSKDIDRGLKYFPLVGACVGVLSATVLIALSAVLPFSVAIIAALAFEALITGALHEDGVADFCDAFGAERDRADTLRILKDSRIGSYGVLGLGFMVALRAAALLSLATPVLAGTILVLSGAVGRLVALAVMASVKPVATQDGLAKTVGNSASWTAFWMGAALVAPILVYGVILDASSAGITVVSLIVFVLWFRSFLVRRIGGVTGDCLGFAAYAGFLLTAVAFAKTV